MFCGIFDYNLMMLKLCFEDWVKVEFLQRGFVFASLGTATLVFFKVNSQIGSVDQPNTFVFMKSQGKFGPLSRANTDTGRFSC